MRTEADNTGKPPQQTCSLPSLPPKAANAFIIRRGPFASKGVAGTFKGLAASNVTVSPSHTGHKDSASLGGKHTLTLPFFPCPWSCRKSVTACGFLNGSRRGGKIHEC